jgi:hypothetical protein
MKLFPLCALASRSANCEVRSVSRILLCAALLLTSHLSLLTSRAGVVINEFMYQPASFNTNEEWIELWNNSTNTVDLAGWSFTKGIDYTFTNTFLLAPNGYAIVAARSNVFAANYPTVAALGIVRGDWTGALRNSGDTITLRDAAGNKVDEVTYATQGDWGVRKRGELHRNHRGWDWQADHDGTDRTLELINPNLPWPGARNSGQNWTASANLDGTPGAPNTAYTTNSRPLILGVVHNPLVPAATNTTTINARVIDPSGGPAQTVKLFWRLDANPQTASFTAATMFDDGAHDDGTAGDGVYGIILPPQTNLAIIEFYVAATSASGLAQATWPAPAIPASDGAGPIGQVANALFQIDNTGLGGSAQAPPGPGAAPNYRLLMTAAEKAERDTIANVDTQSDAAMNCTLITI